MSDPFNLERFRSAQDTIYHRVVAELTDGKKRSHWMWYIFPQIKGLGFSFTAREFAIESIEEGYWRSASKWILRLRKRINISKPTLYLAISYLFKLTKFGCNLSEDNYEKVSAAVVLISAKMNEIYPPKMSSLIHRCSKPFSK